MAKALTRKQMDARITALEEAAEHLGMDWTDDRTERVEGNEMARQIRVWQARLTEQRVRCFGVD